MKFIFLILIITYGRKSSVLDILNRSRKTHPMRIFFLFFNTATENLLDSPWSRWADDGERLELGSRGFLAEVMVGPEGEIRELENSVDSANNTSIIICVFLDECMKQR